MTMRIMVVSDLHANARALRAALDHVHTRGCDRLVILGDLLTYGQDVVEILDLVDAEVSRGATLITGNHDEMYLNLAAGLTDYFQRLPEWLRECVDDTRSRLDEARFASLPWERELVVDDVLLAHANPYAFGDWTYLNADEDNRRAATTLDERGFTLGCFGHTHRALVHVGAGARVVNAGSIGQPRGGASVATLAELTVGSSSPEVAIMPISYDISGHLDTLRASGLSDATKARLCRFFSEPTA